MKKAEPLFSFFAVYFTTLSLHKPYNIRWYNKLHISCYEEFRRMQLRAEVLSNVSGETEENHEKPVNIVSQTHFKSSTVETQFYFRGLHPVECIV
jgi:hypothetical protein